MRLKLISLGLLFALSGCISLGFGGGEPSHTTVIVPQGSTTTCTGPNCP
jgi:hypothetical protein